MTQLFDASTSGSDDNLSIHLSEMTTLNWPTSEELIYKCRVEIRSPFEANPLLRELPARAIPAWMVDFQHQGACLFKLALLCRKPQGTGGWTELGEVEVAGAEALSKETSVNVSLPINGWDLAPRLRLKMRLYKTDRAPGRRQRGLGRLPRISQENGSPRLTSPAFMEASDDDAVEIPDTVSLTPQEKVILKDSWNKFMAFKELSLDMFFRRFIALEDGLGQRMGFGNELLSERLFELFDLTIRQLIPHTENVLREAYRGVHPSSDLECNSVEEYGEFFAAFGVRPRQWLQLREVWMWVLSTMPYIEDYERQNLEKGEASAFFKFFTGRILRPMLQALQRYDETFPAASMQRVLGDWRALSSRSAEAGQEVLVALAPMQASWSSALQGLDLEKPAQALFASFDETLAGLRDWDALIPELRLRDAALRAALPSAPVEVLAQPILDLLQEEGAPLAPQQRQAWDGLFSQLSKERRQAKQRENHVLVKASQYLAQFAEEWGWDSSDLQRRMSEVRDEIAATGTYTHTYEELAFGAQLAWRNSAKCVGRMQWKNLLVRDLRHIQHPDEIFEECVEHLRVANNGGRLQSVMSIFRPRRPGEHWGPRIWNSQLLRYAAYRQSDGSILGDPANAGLTQAILKLGWTPPSPKTAFDFLPLVIETPGKQPSVYELPRDMILEVELEHPTYPQFKQLGLKWSAVPAISNFRIVLGGVDYGCLPFNGWFLCTEIARNLTDATRYDKVEEIAKALQLDMKNDQTMWRDEAYLEVNKAIMYSFQKNKVIIADQHSASRQFLTHDLREKEAGRECPAQWSWVVPPIGGSVCPVYHHEMRDFLLEPQYYHAADRWAVDPRSGSHGGFEEQVLLEDEQRGETTESLLILFNSAAPEVEHLARLAGRRLSRFSPRIRSMAGFSPHLLVGERMVLWMTVGSPEEAVGQDQVFLDWLQEKGSGKLKGQSFMVLALDPSPQQSGKPFSKARALQETLETRGATPLVPLWRNFTTEDRIRQFNRGLGLLGRLLGADPLYIDDASLGRHSRLSVLSLEDSSSLPPFSVPATVPWSPRVAAHVVANEVLAKQDQAGESEGTCRRRIELDLAEDSPWPTDASDDQPTRLRLLRAEAPQRVARLCQRLGAEPEGRVTGHYLGNFGEVLDGELPFDVPTTVGELLTHRVDLNLHPPLEDWMQFLLETVREPAQQQELETILEALQAPRAASAIDGNDDGNGQDDTAYERVVRQLVDSYPDLCDLLEHFSSARVGLADVLELARYAGGTWTEVLAVETRAEGGHRLTLGVDDIAASAADQSTDLACAIGETVHVILPWQASATAP